jgi:hypothetical protein
VQEIDGGTQEADIDLALQQGIILPCGQDVLALDVHVGEALCVSDENTLNLLAEARSQTHSHEAILTSVRPADRVHCEHGLTDEDSRFVHEHATCIGQFDFSPIPHEQLDSQFGFQLLDLAAQWWLGDLQFARGPGEIQCLGYGNKVS